MPYEKIQCYVIGIYAQQRLCPYTTLLNMKTICYIFTISI